MMAKRSKLMLRNRNVRIARGMQPTSLLLEFGGGRTRDLPTRQRGVALVMVLWGCMLLTVVATSFAFSIRAETTIAGNYLQRARAEALADAGVSRGIVELLMPNSESRRVADGSIKERTLGAAKFTFAITSENGKIDLNGAADVLIHGLFSQLVETIPDLTLDDSRRLAKAVIERRKPSRGAQPPQEDEDDPEVPGDGQFLTVSELTRIPGITPEIVAALAGSLTVYTRQPKIDAVSAPRQVLLAIPGLEPERVDQFLAARATFFENKEAPGSRAQSRPPVQQLAPGARYLSRARASVYTVDAEGIAVGGVRARRQAVIQLTGAPKRPYQILAWRDALSRPKSRVDAAMTAKGPERELPAGG
jgi:general secretion pathway protein K